ncbi:hypothetical protein ACFGZ0_09525 [Pasteurella multocida]|uniref:5' nucleotidase, NT5C type n=1 Tax=Pasteurella multocida TaxID=747 RepID=UPI002020369A|nr:hypothetical protein [Pasteurella multocida]MCL7818402.1 hypothetical protein [Pasteurella multocida]MEB3458169.1 hypothetical protein [Pasteurella multocida]MEB3491435.1 hypothetical protein [Pasteurella multocida]WRK08186.1 hypothetical protein RFF38_05075 [Pasteurella multocida]
MNKPLLYVDMDNVLVDFQSGIDQLPQEIQIKYQGRLDEVPTIFSLMKPMENAIRSVYILAKHYDIYILSTSPWGNPSAWMDKLNWIQHYFSKEKGSLLYKRLILSHHKHLHKGDYIIDDRTANGVDKFEGEHIHFGSEQFPNWQTVTQFLLNQAKLQSMLDETRMQEAQAAITRFWQREINHEKIFVKTTALDELHSHDAKNIQHFLQTEYQCDAYHLSTNYGDFYCIVNKKDHPDFHDSISKLKAYYTAEYLDFAQDRNHILSSLSLFLGLENKTLSRKKALRINRYDELSVYQAGNVMGKWAQATAINHLKQQLDKIALPPTTLFEKVQQCYQRTPLLFKDHQGIFQAKEVALIYPPHHPFSTTLKVAFRQLSPSETQFNQLENGTKILFCHFEQGINLFDDNETTIEFTNLNKVSEILEIYQKIDGEWVKE